VNLPNIHEPWHIHPRDQRPRWRPTPPTSTSSSFQEDHMSSYVLHRHGHRSRSQSELAMISGDLLSSRHHKVHVCTCVVWRVSSIHRKCPSNQITLIT
jgi:hypothetical protein